MEVVSGWEATIVKLLHCPCLKRKAFAMGAIVFCFVIFL